MKMPGIMIAINNGLFEKAQSEVDCVRFLSVDHICNIALAEWLNRKAKEDEKEKRQKNFKRRYALSEIQNESGNENEETDQG